MKGDAYLSSFLVLLSLAQAAAGGWTAAGTTGGVTLAFRDDPRLEVREVRATTELSFPAARIFPLVCDFTQYGSLVAGVQETKMMSGSAPSEYDIYLRYAPRFLVVSARDVVVHVQGQSAPDGTSRAIGLMSRNESLSAKASSECRSCAAAGQSSRWTRCALASCTRWRSIPAGGYQAGSYAAARSAHCRR